MLREFVAQEEDFKARSLHETYGISDLELDTLETPFVEFRFYYRVPYRMSWLLGQQLKPFSKVVTWYDKYYFKVQGTTHEINELTKMIPNGVQLIHRDKIWERGVIFSADRWVRLPEIGIPLKVQHP